MYSDISDVIINAKKSLVTHILNICTDKVTFERGLKLSKEHKNIFLAAATTPHDVVEGADEMFEIFAAAARNGDLDAVGETGLDYFYEKSPKDIQKKYFARYIDLCLETKLPLIIHCRDAFADLLQILDDNYLSKGGDGAKVVIHCFTGTVEEARQCLQRNFRISLSGIVTFKKSTELQEAAKIIPLSNLLIETDSPYLAPHPFRGKRNEPAMVVHTAEFIANLKQVQVSDIASSTFENGIQLLAKDAIDNYVFARGCE